MVYNKLVRDKIPDIIRQQGKKPLVRILENGEYATVWKVNWTRRLRNTTGIRISRSWRISLRWSLRWLRIWAHPEKN